MTTENAPGRAAALGPVAGSPVLGDTSRALPEDADEPQPTHCECGVALDAHPPLPKPGPLRSWKSLRAEKKLAEPGKSPAARQPSLPPSLPPPAPPGTCSCGCRGTTNRPTSRYLPGHNAKLHSLVRRAETVAEQ